jgi:integrase
VLAENNTRQGFFERPDLEAVVTALPAYLQDLTRFAYLTGWRKGEIISLRWTDVDRDTGGDPPPARSRQDRPGPYRHAGG